MKQVKYRDCKEARNMSFSCKISGSSHLTLNQNKLPARPGKSTFFDY